MLHKISKNEYNRYVDFVYNLSHDLSKCSFPIYNDGVKTKEYFCEKSLKALDRDDEEILLYEKDGKAKGWIHFYFIQSDKYLGISCMLIEKDFGNALAELLEYWQNKKSFKSIVTILKFSEKFTAITTTRCTGTVTE